MRFDELDLDDSVLDGLYAMHFEEMTPVQELSIPPILQGRDVIACAQTGTGKTAAYVLPVINKLCKGGYPEDAINAIIMAPTRELALQIDQQIEGFTYYIPISTVAVYGGTDGIVYTQQERGLQMGADIVIATPGRLIAHLNLSDIDLSRVSFFILDEADRMLDMGFYDDIISIFKKLPKECQIILFSATMPPKIKTLAENMMKNPQEIEIAISKPPESILQSAYICYENQKLQILGNLFKVSNPKRVILFASSKQKVKELAIILHRMQINVAAMHSDLEQSAREQVMKDFRNGRIDVLVATDVVARGIDIVDISMIINYNAPKDPDDYVHRIGRTARGAEGKGLAITLVSDKEQHYFKKIETHLGHEIYKISLDATFGKTPEYKPETQVSGKKFSHIRKRTKTQQSGSKTGRQGERTKKRTGERKKN
jgi:superfamily II DNA/RNA helicase